VVVEEIGVRGWRGKAFRKYDRGGMGIEALLGVRTLGLQEATIPRST